MKKLNKCIDSNIIVRYLHLHCFWHLIKVYLSSNAQQVFSYPRFHLFPAINRIYSSKNTKNALFRNLIENLKNDFILGIIMTCIFASLNLLVPSLIKSFLHNMQSAEIRKTDQFLMKFVTVQVLRIIFGGHTKRLFTQLALKIQSSLSRKLISKSLHLAKQCSDRIPQSQINQLENVDLRLVYTLFKNMHQLIEAPFTIIISILLLFSQGKFYGIIGIYWFLIAFLLQRELDERMAECNQTKLGLIDKRSRVNYELLQKIKHAKITHNETLMIEKNNDFFIEQNHDHKLFYFYATLFDITLLLLPILVVFTILLYDLNNPNPINVQQVYVMLSLLGICYNPMKSFRTVTINLHDGLHSLNRLQKYFNLPEETISTLINHNHPQGQLMIKKGTICTYPHSSSSFEIKINHHIELHKGDRLIVLGRKTQGSTSFLEMLLGNLKKLRGTVFINGKISFCKQKNFLLNQTIKENIVFYNQKISNEQVQQVYNQLGLSEDLKITKGLDASIDDENNFTKDQLRKIALARVFCSNADIMIFDSPFNALDYESTMLVEKILRQKQKQGKTIIIALKDLLSIEPNDHIIILQQGKTVQYGIFKDMISKENSRINKFFKNKEDDQVIEKIIKKFQKSVSKDIIFQRIIKNTDKNEKSIKNTQISRSFKNKGKLSRKLKINLFKHNNQYFSFYIKKFFYSINFSQAIYIVLIIASAQFLHIFIHFYLGHLDGHSKEAFRNTLMVQMILTIILASIVYLEGEISSYIAIIQGNNLYRQAITQLTNKPIKWFTDEYSVRIADRFNHDYQEVFIACHTILNLYKNIIICIATILIVSYGKKNLLILSFFVSIVYFVVLMFLRTVQQKVIKHYYDYKYRYVKIFNESNEGATIFEVFQVQQQVIAKAERAYQNLAAYKLAEYYTAQGQEIICDLLSLFLVSTAMEYGTELKGKGNIAMIATSIHLLMNLSEVLKTIVKLEVYFQTFFQINLIPLLTICDPNKIQKSLTNETKNKDEEFNNKIIPISKYSVRFYNVLLRYDRIGIVDTVNPLTLDILKGQKVFIYEIESRCANLLLFALTRNLPMFNEPEFFKRNSNCTVKICDQDIRDLSNDRMRSLIGVIDPFNFYFSGTLRQNLSWKMPIFHDEVVDRYIKLLGINEHLQNYETEKLNSRIEYFQENMNQEVVKKLAVLKILLIKPKIIILKNTTSFIGSISIVQILTSCIPQVTIIKISNKIEEAFDMDRIIYMQKLKIKQDGYLNDLIRKNASYMGALLKQSNVDGYLYKNQVDASPRKIKRNVNS